MAVHQHHLAQLNVARLRAPLDAPETAGFVAALDPVNAVADGTPGFVWRLQTDEGDATAIQTFEDDLVIVNLTVWESVDALRSFTYSGDHRDVVRRRGEWFVPHTDPYLVLWWVPVGTEPTVEEAKVRLGLLRRHGPTAEAFTFRDRFPAPGAVAG